MDKIQTIIQIINTTGFPIFCVLALGWYVKSIMDKMETTLVDLRMVVQSNTEVINRLCEKIGEEKHERLSE